MEASAKPPIDLATLAEEQLLDLRICDLPLTIENTWLEKCVAQLHRELNAKGIVFQPHCYLADEWLTPEDEPVIGIPFFLAHPRLIELEKKMMLEAEGEGESWCMKLLRHEAGHAVSYAYGLHRKRSWKKVFGSSTAPYEDTYRFRPYSKSFVRHLDFYYAQYHPDEDFVETFAVWLTPGLDWRQKYKGWSSWTSSWPGSPASSRRCAAAGRTGRRRRSRARCDASTSAGASPRPRTIRTSTTRTCAACSSRAPHRVKRAGRSRRFSPRIARRC
jgi:hypothetical protein